MGWDVVGYGSDPIPDDPAVIAAQVDHLRAVAKTIQTQLDHMPREGHAGCLTWDSDAAEGFKRVVQKLPKDLESLKVRYVKVADALAVFNRTVKNSRCKARDALCRAETAADEVCRCQAGVHSMNDFAEQSQHLAASANQGAPPGAVPMQPEPWTGPDWSAQLTTAQRDLQQAKHLVDEAVGEFRDAARVAAEAIDRANHDSLKDDTSLWGGIKRKAHWLTENLPIEALAGLMSKIAAVLAIAALIFPALAGAALLAGALVLILDAILAINEAHEGTFGWHNVITLALDTVSVATGVAGLKFLGPAAKAAGTAAATASRNAAAAGRAAKAATAAKSAAKAGVGASRARVAYLQRSRFRTVLNALTGRTGAAKSQLARSETTLAAAADAEARAIAIKRTREAAAANAAQKAQRLDVIDHRADVVGVAADVIGATTTVVDEQGLLPTLASPATATAISIRNEVVDLTPWGSRAEVADAGQTGQAISAQPIP